MMHKCSNSCSCGLFHHHHHHSQSNCNSFSMIFSMSSPPPSLPNHKPYEEADRMMMYGGSFVSSSPSVDCTLSLGTPSTRLTINDNEKREQRRSSCMSNFCWDILQSKNTVSAASVPKSHRGSNSIKANSGGSDTLLARRCANCDTTSTPLWRNGPRGPKSLCNACGIRFKKEERRATAAAATNVGSSTGGAPVASDTQHMINSSWVHHHSQSQRMMPCLSSAYGNEFRFIEDDEREAHDTSIPFLSWRFNVADRPSLVHDFTR